MDSTATGKAWRRCMKNCSRAARESRSPSGRGRGRAGTSTSRTPTDTFFASAGGPAEPSTLRGAEAHDFAVAEGAIGGNAGLQLATATPRMRSRRLLALSAWRKASSSLMCPWVHRW